MTHAARGKSAATLITVTAVLGLLAAAAAAGCAAGLRPAELLNASELSQLPSDDEERFGKAPVVALRRHERFSIHTPTGEPIYTDIQRHVALLVRSEEGIDDWSSIRISMDKDSEMLHFEARTISPSGVITPVEPGHIFDDKASRGDDQASFRVFQFPRVEVGGVLEYTYTRRMKGYYTVMEHGVTGSYPVVDYALEIIAPRSVIYEARLHNAAGDFIQDKVGSSSRLRLFLRDVPFHKSNDFAPHWTRRSPWWEFRIKHFAWRYNTYKVTHSWRDTFRHFAERIYTRDDKYFDGFDLKLDQKCGEEPSCKIASALRVVRDRAEIGSFAANFWDIQPAKTVLAAGTANNFEKAVLLFGLLDDAGVEARFALLPRRFTREVNKRSPSIHPMNHAVLYLPPQPGLEGGVWIDPSCEWCAAGQLPSWSLDVEALVIGFEEKAFQRKEGIAEWRFIRGAPAPVTRQRYLYDATVEEGGDVLVELVIEDYGAHAFRRRRQTRSDSQQDRLQRAERRARAALATARLQDFDAPSCDRAVGRCVHRYRYRLPAFAAHDGEELLLPLSIFQHAYDRRLLKKKRDHDIVADEDDEVISELRVRVPPGRRVRDLPDAQPATSALASASFASRSHDDGFWVQRITRTTAGAYAKARYKELRRPLEASREARQTVVSLVPAAAPKGE